MAGIVRPFRFGANGDPVTGTGEALRGSRAGQVLGTRASSPRGAGEIPWLLAFGSLIELLRQANIDAVRLPLAVVYARQALGRWTGEVVVSARVTRDPETPELKISITTRERSSTNQALRQDVRAEVSLR